MKNETRVVDQKVEVETVTLPKPKAGFEYIEMPTYVDIEISIARTWQEGSAARKNKSGEVVKADDRHMVQHPLYGASSNDAKPNCELRLTGIERDHWLMAIGKTVPIEIKGTSPKSRFYFADLIEGTRYEISAGELFAEATREAGQREVDRKDAAMARAAKTAMNDATLTKEQKIAMALKALGFEEE